MMAMTSTCIFRYLKAKTEKGLELRMIENNAKRKSFHNYQIMWNGKEYIAWYVVDLSGLANKDLIEIEKELDGTTDNSN